MKLQTAAHIQDINAFAVKFHSEHQDTLKTTIEVAKALNHRIPAECWAMLNAIAEDSDITEEMKEACIQTAEKLQEDCHWIFETKTMGHRVHCVLEAIITLAIHTDAGTAESRRKSGNTKHNDRIRKGSGHMHYKLNIGDRLVNLLFQAVAGTRTDIKMILPLTKHQIALDKGLAI